MHTHTHTYMHAHTNTLYLTCVWNSGMATSKGKKNYGSFLCVYLCCGAMIIVFMLDDDILT